MGTMDMYTASDGREFGSGTVGRMYDEYLASLGQQDSNTSNTRHLNQNLYLRHKSPMDFSQALILKILKILTLVKTGL
jgi:hypothetical protein